jgi:hypothetical protein
VTDPGPLFVHIDPIAEAQAAALYGVASALAASAASDRTPFKLIDGLRAAAQIVRETADEIRQAGETP